MYFDQVHPPIPYIQFLPTPAFPSRCICLELRCVYGCGTIHWSMDRHSGAASLKKRDFPSPSTSSARGGTPFAPP